MWSGSVRSGFGLIELVVAIAISGLVLLGARAMLEQLADSADYLNAAATQADRQANADGLLRALVGHVVAATETPGAVVGDAETALLATWCDVPAGWQERCTVLIELLRRERVLLATLSTGERLILRSGFDQGSLLYLSDARHGGAWVTDWRIRTDTPLALGVVLDGDTIILRIGERG